VPRGEFLAKITGILDEIQTALFERAKAYRAEHTKTIDTKDDFYAFFAEPAKKQSNDPTPIHAGFAMAHFNGDPALEAKIKDDLKVTVRCIPLGAGEPGTCPFTGQPSKQRVVWAKAY
jgi:prolyl-tRNA synthetase